MKITINIDERTGTAIREFCKANNLKQNQYLVDIIEKQFNIDRFGDMNEMLAKKEKPKQVQMKLVEEKETPIKEIIKPFEEETAAQSNQKKTLKRTLKVKE